MKRLILLAILIVISLPVSALAQQPPSGTVAISGGTITTVNTVDSVTTVGTLNRITYPVEVTESEPVYAQAATSVAASASGVAATTSYYPAYNGFTLTNETAWSASIDVNTATQTITVECTNSASFWNGAIIDITRSILDLSDNTTGNASFNADAFLHTENLTAARCRFKVVTTGTGNNITIELKKRY